jgi:hypothetical protein
MRYERIIGSSSGSGTDRYPPSAPIVYRPDEKDDGGLMRDLSSTGRDGHLDRP